MDALLFAQRRLGYGPRLGEHLAEDPRDWALAQLATIPDLDFYAPDGSVARDAYPAEAEPHRDFAEACRAWEIYRQTVEKHQKRAGAMSNSAFEQMMHEEVWMPYVHIPRWRDCLVTTLTAVNGPSPVFERFWSFWVNHFAVGTTEAEIKLFYGPHTRNIRARMTGSFLDMLRDAVLNPAMLVYLDNWLSTGPNSSQGKRHDGNLNENLARELFELHTMGPEAGYTQADVEQCALVLTGWQFYAGLATHPKRLNGDPYGTYFQTTRHEPGTLTVMGKSYSGGSRQKEMDEVADMLADFAALPQTAYWVAGKLARHFIADEPPKESVEAIASAFMSSDGHLPTVHAAVVDEVLRVGPRYKKFTTPQNWYIQALRITGDSPPSGKPFPGTGRYWIDGLYKELGQAWDECPQPNGWSDLSADWISKELLDRRIRVAHAFDWSKVGQEIAAFEDFAIGLAGSDSDLVRLISEQRWPTDKGPLLLVSPQFLRV